MKWLIVLATFFMFTAPALALCLPRNAYVEGLAEGYGEKPAAHGLVANGDLMELFVSRDDKTWTLIITSPNGISCPLASGDNWRKTMPELLKPTGLPI